MENERHLFAASFLALLCAAMISYFLASLIDPGYVHVKSSVVDVESGVDFQDTVRYVSILFMTYTFLYCNAVCYLELNSAVILCLLIFFGFL